MVKVSHIIYKVTDLKEAVERFKECGFRVIYGSDPKKASNALVWFKDGPFIEIMKVNREYYNKMKGIIGLLYGNSAKDKVISWCEISDGFCDIAVEDENNEGFNIAKVNNKNMKLLRKKLSMKGITTSRLIKGTRINTNKIKIRYSLFYLADRNYPFAVSAYEVDEKPKDIVHKNGARSISKIYIQVPEILYEDYNKLFENDKRVVIEKGSSVKIKRINIEGLEKRLFFEETIVSG